MTAPEVIAGPLVLLRGRVSDALTGEGLAGEGLAGEGLAQAGLRADVRQGGDWFALPFALRGLGGGWYAASARLTEIAALLRFGVATEFRLRAAAAGHVTAEATVALTAAQFSRVTATQTIEGVAVTVSRLAGAPVILNLALLPRPVMLAGLVIDNHDPASPVSGATISIAGSAATATTDARGRFRIDVPPLARTWTVRATLGARSVEVLHVTDFALPVNFASISLPPAPPPNP